VDLFLCWFVGPALLVAVAVGLTTAGCTGDDSANHELTFQEIPPGEKVIIDDFERMAPPGVCTKAPPQNCYELGAWYPYDDGSITIDPEAGLPESGPPAELETIELAPHEDLVTYDPAKPPSKTALRIHGGPYSGVWGAGFSHPFADSAPMPLTDYAGVVFWARKGPNAVSVLHVAITSLDDTGPAQLPDGSTPICHDPPTPGTKDGCNDPFGRDVVLYQDWHPYVIFFSELSQQGGGYKPPGGFDRKNATGIAFGNKQGKPFDEYIDDIALFK